MDNKNLKKKEINYERNSIKEEKDLNCFLFEDKNGDLSEDIFLKDKKENNSFKNSIDLNLTGKKLHEFLNDDLIEALDDDLVEPKEICDMSDSNSCNEFFEGSSECTSKANSPEFNIKYPKKIKDIDMNLNIENSSDKNDSNNINYNYSVNKHNLNIQIKNINNNIKENNQIKEEEEEDKDIKFENKEKISLINNPNFTSKFIPRKIRNNINDIKLNEIKEYNFENSNNKKEKTNPLNNKFDEVEPIIMLSLANREEQPKFPYEIRVGDWICLYCNNLNFSFRTKCNRCGLLRISSTLLLKHKYFYNNYPYFDNFNNDRSYINYSKICKYDLNYDVNNNNNNL